MIDTGLLIAYAGLGLMAVTPIWLGSFESLLESKKSDSKSDRLSSEDAYWFPVIGSGVLFGFYLLFKYFNKDYINYLLTAYFAMFGAASLGSQLSKLLVSLIPPETANIHAFDLKLARHDKSGSLIDTVISWPVVLSYLLSAIFTTFYVYTKHWVASNIFSLTFAISAISLIHLDSFYTGICLLAGLFFYDVFWVFGTDVMVKVAKSFDVPVKLLFPKNILDWSTPYRDFALLGLGDIVIPGVFVALCLKFDEHLASKKNQLSEVLLLHLLRILHHWLDNYHCCDAYIQSRSTCSALPKSCLHLVFLRSCPRPWSVVRVLCLYH